MTLSSYNVLTVHLISLMLYVANLQIYSIDLQHGIGRLSVHGWVGVMHEIRRTANDYGLTCMLLLVLLSVKLLPCYHF